jgi:Uma2 family endonuclease
MITSCGGEPMNVLLQTLEVTPEDLLQMGHGPRVELVNGRLVRKAMGQESDFVALNLGALLKSYSSEGQKGQPFGQGSGYQVFPHEPQRVRYPDVSFIRVERMPPEGPARGHCRVAPDFVAEVVSPNDLVEDLFARIEDFLRAGTRVVWVINPSTRSVVFWCADGTGGWRREGGQLNGEDAMPGFTCQVADLFRGLAPPQQVEPDEV